MNTIISGPYLPAEAESRNAQNPQTQLTPAQLVALLNGSSISGRAESVTPQASMHVATVWCCVNIIANAIARMPLVLYRRTKDGRERARNHPLYELMMLRPNPTTSAFALRHTQVVNRLLWGDSFSQIVKTRVGIPQEVRILPSAVTRTHDESGELRYKTIRDGREITLLRHEVLHVPGLSFDGRKSLSVIQHARRTIGAALGSDEFSDGFMANGLRPSGVLRHPGKLGDKAVQNLRVSFESLYGGPRNSGRPMILEEGMEWDSMAMPLEDAQWVETAHFRVEEICRWFGVPPSKVHHLIKMSYSSSEHADLDFLGDTCAPLCEAIQQEFNYKLLLPEEREDYYFEHHWQSIVKMDSKARVEYYRGLSGVGAVSSDEIRDRENMNHIPDGRGSIFWINSTNMPAPTPEQADRITESWIKKGETKSPGGANGPDDKGGKPNPSTDDKVAQS